ncbi:MAG: DUF1934 domain-containing protein [Clostridia bacterium]|nr:DUF1934 domain-containing protein [Clostridia bacterium]
MKNTKENATIAMVSTQRANGEENKIEFTTRGGFYFRDGNFYITYQEHSDIGMGDSRVILKIGQDCVTMRRMGDFQTVMVYKKGEVTDFIYRVPFGELSFKIDTKDIKSTLGEDGGRLTFSYLLIAAGDATQNEVSLTVRKED